jgi:hypothetical protein
MDTEQLLAAEGVPALGRSRADVLDMLRSAEGPLGVRDVAQRHQDVICSLHLGLMQGALARLRAPLGADKLVPFVEPGLCVAQLTAREDQAERRPAATGTR